VRVLASPDRNLQGTMELLVDWGVPQDPFHEGLCGQEQLQTKGKKAQGPSCVISQADSREICPCPQSHLVEGA
jgi:hypothetical protein